MQLANVTDDDGRRCAALIKLIATGRWDLSGKDAEELVRVKQWIQQLAGQMADQLRSKQPAPPATQADIPPAPAGGFRVRAAGPISTGKAGRKSKKGK